MSQDLSNGQRFRVFIDAVMLDGQAGAAYTMSKIDQQYLAENRSPCGKVKLRPEITVPTKAGDLHNGITFVPLERSEAILEGCSMQRDDFSDEEKQLQRAQYELGRKATLAFKAG